MVRLRRGVHSIIQISAPHRLVEWRIISASRGWRDKLRLMPLAYLRIGDAVLRSKGDVGWLLRTQLLILLIHANEISILFKNKKLIFRNPRILFHSSQILLINNSYTYFLYTTADSFHAFDNRGRRSEKLRQIKFISIFTRLIISIL